MPHRTDGSTVVRLSRKQIARPKEAFDALLGSRNLNFLMGPDGRIGIDRRVTDLVGSDALAQLLFAHIHAINRFGPPVPHATTPGCERQGSRGSRLVGADRRAGRRPLGGWPTTRRGKPMPDSKALTARAVATGWGAAGRSFKPTQRRHEQKEPNHMIEPFSSRQGHRPPPEQATAREDAPPEMRGAILMLAKAAGMKPSAIREVICGVLLVLPDPNNWSEYPNIWDEVVWLMDDAPGDKVHGIVEALYAALAAPRSGDSRSAPEFARRLNDFLAENGIGWELIDGHITEKTTASMAIQSGKTASETAGRVKKGPAEAPRYQVALSFAGEQRDYVEEVARHLQSRSIAVFYDGFEEVGLWGRSGVEAFHAAFAEQSAYVVMFISEAYVSKAWPNHERRSALSRMIKEKDEYILPVRFDGTRVPGLPTDIIYECAQERTPAQLATMIAQKLGVQPFAGKASQVPPRE